MVVGRMMTAAARIIASATDFCQPRAVRGRSCRDNGHSHGCMPPFSSAPRGLKTRAFRERREGSNHSLLSHIHILFLLLCFIFMKGNRKNPPDPPSSCVFVGGTLPTSHPISGLSGGLRRFTSISSRVTVRSRVPIASPYHFATIWEGMNTVSFSVSTPKESSFLRKCSSISAVSSLSTSAVPCRSRMTS